MDRTDVITELLKECSDPLMRKQMCLLLGRHRVNYEVEESEIEDDNVELLNELIGNEKLSEQFLKLAQDLDVMDPQTPEDIFSPRRAAFLVDEIPVVRRPIRPEPTWRVLLSTPLSIRRLDMTNS